MIDEMVHPLGYYHFSAVPPLNAALSLSLSLSQVVESYKY